MGENLILIKVNGSRVPLECRRTATCVTSAKQTWGINGEDKVNITVESTCTQSYNIGDRINVFGRVYNLNRLPRQRKTGANAFVYDLEFEGAQYDLLRVTYDININTTDSELCEYSGDSLTGDLERFMLVLLANIRRVFGNEWTLGVLPSDTETKTLTFGEDDNCLSVLQTLCNADNYDCEFLISTNVSSGRKVLNLYKRVGGVLPYTFRFGRGGGLYELSRDNVSSSNLVTVLKAYGSTENISYKYRADRLCLPGKTKAESIIENDDVVDVYGIFEGRKNFDDIKPSYTGYVSSVGEDVLTFRDENFPFDLNEKNEDGETKYLIPGAAAKIHFNTGNLAGYEFTIKSYDNATQTFVINKITDERGNEFPSVASDAFKIKVGDSYKILDITYSNTIIEEAEQRLAEAAQAYYDENSQPKVQYSLSVTKEWLQKQVGGDEFNPVNVFIPGDSIHIVDDDIAVDKTIRIKSFVRDLRFVYDYQLTISDMRVESSLITRVLGELDAVDKVLTINNLKSPAQARANWRSSREVLEMVFDGDGDYYTEKIKPNSIDTQLLSVGAKGMQFGLQNVTFIPNYNGNKNILAWKGGTLTHYTIKDDEFVAWTIGNGQQLFVNDSYSYYIYAQCHKTMGYGNIICTRTQHKVDEGDMYYYFNIGVLNSVDPELKARSIALTYGFTMVSGRFIRTGRIESADQTTYFDLDNGEIGGHIKFVSNNGTIKDVAEVEADATSANDYITKTLPGILDELQAQVDGQIEQFFYDVDPYPTDPNDYDETKFNEPFKSWYEAMDDDPEALERHLGDLYYNVANGRVFRLAKISYRPPRPGAQPGWRVIWVGLSDDELSKALALANDALALATTKRRIFTTTPYPPYDIGDIWLNGEILQHCATARTENEVYHASDWIVSVNYDNTQTTIDGGLVTSGTIQVAGDKSKILAGITGAGTNDDDVRVWAGATFEERANAPFRALQNGKVVMKDADVTGVVHATSGTFKGRIEANEGIFHGSIATPPQAIADNTTTLALSFKDGFNFTGVLSSKGACKQITLPTDAACNGVHCSIINYGSTNNGYYEIKPQNGMNLMYCGRPNNMNPLQSIHLYGTSEVRLKAIMVSNVIRWFVENVNDFSFDYINSRLTNGMANQIMRCLGSYWMTGQTSLQKKSCNDGNEVKFSSYTKQGIFKFVFTKARTTNKDYSVVVRNESGTNCPYKITSKTNTGFTIEFNFQHPMGIEGINTIYVETGGWGFDILEYDV